MATARPKTERRKTSRSKAILADTANDSIRIPESDIALKAYLYYCERGFQGGSPLDDWLRAERELKATARSAK
jgi:hypothetical protein